MSDRAISEEALLAGLRDIHLPATAPGGDMAEVAAAVALAGCLALLTAGFVRLMAQRRHAPPPETLAQTLASLSDLPETDRRVALLHLLKDRAPDRFAEIQERLYKPATGLDSATLEQELARYV